MTTRARSARARAHRRSRRPEERPQELLEAALRVFAERGYRRARIDDVAQAAGVTKGAVYHYFDTKEALLCRAIEHYHEQLFGELETALRGTTGPTAVRIRLLMRRLFGGEEPNHRRVLALLLQGVRHEVPTAHRQWLAGGPVKGWKLLASLIERGQQAGEFRRDADAEVAARVAISGLMTQLVWQPLAPTVPGVAVDVDRLIDSTTELLLHALRPVALRR
jgi:AcrR family transcriptional regulator